MKNTATVTLTPQMKFMYALKITGLLITTLGFAYLWFYMNIVPFLIGLMIWVVSIVYGFIVLRNVHRTGSK